MSDRNSEQIAERSADTGSPFRSQEQLAALFEQTAAGLAETTPDGRFIRANARYCEIVGRSLEELLGMRMQDITHPDDLPRNLELFGRMLSEGTPFEIEKRYVRPDGSTVWVRNTVSRIQPGDGREPSVLAVSIDFSQAKTAEAALRETSQRLNAIINNTRMALFMMDDRQHCVFMNRAAEDLTGFRFEEIKGRPLHDIIHNKHPDGSHYPLEDCPIDRAFPEDDQVEGEEMFVHKDGHFYPVAFTASPIRDDAGKAIGTIVEARDVSAEKEREEALRENESRFRTVFQNAGVGMLEIDENWCILGANRAFSQITGYPIEELIGKSCLALTHPDDVEQSEEALRSVAHADCEQTELEKRYIRKDGRIVWIRSNLSRISGTDESPRFLKVLEDITDMRAAKDELDEQRRTLETLNRTGSSLSGELDLQKVVQMVTDAGVELTGAQFGAFFYNVIGQEGESYMLYTLSGAEPSQFDFGMPRNTAVFHPTFSGEGTIRSDDITSDPRYGKSAPHYGMPKGHLPVRSYLAVPVISRSGDVIGGLFFGHEKPALFTEAHERLMLGLASQAAISIDNARLYQAVQHANELLEQRVEERTVELERANEALRQAQKMEAIGQLTGGIAHDFNNMLTVILGSADVLKRSDLSEEKRARYVDAIAETADRAARLTSQLLAFARRQALKPEAFDAAERVKTVAEMLRTLLGSRIRLEVAADCHDSYVEADPTQFEAALVNMAVNARDSMDGEGDLRIAVERVERLPIHLSTGESGAFVAISVRDTGHGVDPADLDKIFEPFFTTKSVGKGTGLGLSQVYGFAKQSGGEVAVESEVGKGSTFTIFLPEAAHSPNVSPSQPQVERGEHRGGRVLVVEDNRDVGSFAEQVLADLGYETTLAGNADEAMSRLEVDHDQFDVVFSDIVMPGTDGIDFARRVRERWPDLPVVLTSGYSHVLADRTPTGFPLLQKPYSLESLQRALSEALDE